MSVTYSINQDSSIESTRKIDINSVLQSLPNNTQKLIRPRDVRDGFLSTWASSAFKITKPQNSNLEYIGLDSGNPNNRDIKNKILIGKRNFGNIDIMNNQLLNSNTDIFFYNTKDDTEDQSSTKIGIIAGTQPNLNAPYFESFATASQFNFNIVNPSGGDISIKSTTGNVFLNDIPFPKVSETPSDGDVLKYTGVYPLGKLEWGQADIAVTSTIGTPNQETNIFGSEVNLNGFSLEFIDNTLVPVTIGGVEQGFSFSTGSFQGQNWPLSEVIRKLIYPYISPKLEISVFNQETGLPYGDIGFPSLVTITYSITTFARENSEDLFNIKVTRQNSDELELDAVIQLLLEIDDFSDSPGGRTFSSISNLLVYGNSEFKLSLNNIIDSVTNTYSVSKTFEMIRPFVVFQIDENSSQNISNNDILNSTGNSSQILTSVLLQESSFPYFKKILPYEEGNDFILNTNSNNVSYLYLSMPFEYPIINGILDNSNGLISSLTSFTYSSVPVNTGSTYSEYRIYKFLSPSIINNSISILFDQTFSSFGINDTWTINPINTSLVSFDFGGDNIQISDFLLPIPPGVSGSGFSTIRRFTNSTSSIYLSTTSFNSNNYSERLNLQIGDIIFISQQGQTMKYVVNGLVQFNFLMNTALIPVQAIIPGNPVDITVSIGTKINFRVL